MTFELTAGLKALIWPIADRPLYDRNRPIADMTASDRQWVTYETGLVGR
jgi:hypothetical protein